MHAQKVIKRFIGLSALIVGSAAGVFGVSFAYATWNGQPYSAGATLNPECAPTDVNCTVASTTLQAAYTSGNGIVATDGRDITFTLSNTTTDPNLTVNLQGQGVFQIENNGSAVVTVAQNGTLTVANEIDNGLTANALVYANGSKQLASATISAPLSFSGGVFSISQASSSTSGYLSSGDWNTFNNKQNALTPGTGVSLSGNTINTVWTKSGNDIYANNSGHVGIGTTSPSANAQLSVAGGALIAGGVTTDTLTASALTAASSTLTGGTTVTGGLTADAVTVASSTLGVITNSTWDGTAVGLAFGGTGASNVTNARTNLGLAYATSTQLNYYPIVAWGDSLTAGGEDGTGVTYPNTLATILGRPVTTKAVGGQTSTQIGVRQGGVQATVTISTTTGQIPASGGVQIYFPVGYEPVTSQGPAQGVNGTLDGIYGTVTFNSGTGVYTFTRSVASTSPTTVASAPFIPDNGTLNNGTVVIWAGRNNFTNTSQVESDIANMVASLGSNQHYLILSIDNGEYSGEYVGQPSYNSLITLNTYLASTYAGHYLDIRSYLIQQGLSDAGITPTASDTADIANDTVPSSLRTDNIHLNYIGYRLVARQVANYIKSTIDQYNNSGVVTTSFLNNAFTSAYQVGNATTTAGYFTSVGIGTSTPYTQLAVSSSGNTTITIAGGSASGSTAAINLISGFSGVYGNASIKTNNAALQFDPGTVGGTNRALIFSIGGSEISRFTSTGNLGIGTSSPLSALAVSGGMTVGADYNFAAPGNGLLVEGNTGIGTGAVAPVTKFEVVGNSSTLLGYDTTTANSTLQMGKFALLSLVGDGSVNNGPNIGMLQLNIGAANVSQAASELYLGATRATTASAHASVGNTDVLGRIGFYGDDGTNDRTRGAQIQGDVNTTYQATSTGVIPTQLSLATAFQSPIAFFTNYGFNAGSYSNTNSALRMIILPNGNIGIGTSTPNSKLSVAGGTSIGADYGNAAPTNGLVVEGNVGIGMTSPATALGVNGTASTTNLVISGITNGATQCVQIDAVGNITGTGSACGSGGSGTPGGASGQIQFNNGGAFGGSSGLTWDNTNTRFAVGSSTPWGTLSVQAANNSPYAQFAVGSSTASTFFVTNTGNVSIGVAPSNVVQKLEVNGSVRATGYYGATLANGSTSGILSILGGANTASSPGGQIDLTASSNATPGLIIFRTGTSAGASPEVARFTSTGSLGISTSSPWGLLSLNGTSSLNGAPQFVIGSSTGTNFIVTNTGFVGIGTTSPLSALALGSGQFATPQGSAAAPSLASSGDLSTGIYFGGSNNISFSAGGAQKILISTSGLSASNSGAPAIQNVNVSGTSPGLIPDRADVTTGIGADAAGAISLITSGSTKLEILNNGNVGIGTSSPGARLDIAGANGSLANLFELSSVSGSATTTEFTIQNNGNGWMAGTLTQASDQRLKTNVQPLEGSSTLAAIESLQPVSFNWVNSLHGDGLQVGFIAQSVQKIFPNLVSTSAPTTLTPDGTLGVNYIGLIAPTIKALQELAHQVSDMAQSVTTQVLTAATGNFNQVKTQQLCVGDTCVTESQLKMLLQESGQTGGVAAPTATIATSPSSAPAQEESSTTPSSSTSSSTESVPTAPNTTTDTTPSSSDSSSSTDSGSPSATTDPTSSSSSTGTGSTQ